MRNHQPQGYSVHLSRTLDKRPDDMPDWGRTP
jgi:hypothetical protein